MLEKDHLTTDFPLARLGRRMIRKLLPFLLILCPPLLAVELENKEGRKLDGEILEADADRVKILMPETGREHVLNRAELAPHSNGKIDDFITARRQRENFTAGERVTFELEDKEEGRKKRVSILLPEPGISSRPFGGGMEFSGGAALNHLDVRFWGVRPPEAYLDESCKTDLEGQMGVILENSKDLPEAELAVLRSLLKIESRQVGPWKMWMLAGWDTVDIKRFPALGRAACDALIHDPEHLLRLRLSAAPGGIFRPWMLPLIIESIQVEP